MPFNLDESIAEIDRLSRNENLSDDMVCALMSIYLSLSNMAVVIQSVEESEETRYYRQAIERLSNICEHRCVDNQSIERRCRMTSILYQSFDAPDTMLDERKYVRCVERMYQILSEWRKGQQEESSHHSDMQNKYQYGILRCIVEVYADVIEEDKQSDEDFLYLKGIISDWSKELLPSGRWIGLSDREAMLRLDIMTRYSNLHSDDRYEAEISKASRYYSSRITGNAESDGQTIYHLYQTLTSGLVSEEITVDRVVSLAARKSEAYSERSEDRLWCLAVCIDRESVRIIRDVKLRLIAQSA